MALQTIEQVREHDTQLIAATKDAMLRGKPYDGRSFIEACARMGILPSQVEREVDEQRQWDADAAEYARINDPARVEAPKAKCRDLRAKVDEMLARHKAELRPVQDELARATSDLAQISKERNDAVTRYAHIRRGQTKEEIRAETERRMNSDQKINVGTK